MRRGKFCSNAEWLEELGRSSLYLMTASDPVDIRQRPCWSEHFCFPSYDLRILHEIPDSKLPSSSKVASESRWSLLVKHESKSSDCDVLVSGAITSAKAPTVSYDEYTTSKKERLTVQIRLQVYAINFVIGSIGRCCRVPPSVGVESYQGIHHSGLMITRNQNPYGLFWPFGTQRTRTYLFGENLNDTGIISISRAWRRRGKLKKDARIAIRIFETIGKSEIPNKLAVFQTQEHGLKEE